MPKLNAAVPLSEKNALEDLYTTTNGASWTISTNWNTDDPCENNWSGITCNAGNTNVTRILLPDKNLVGNIPTSIGNLSQLEFLALGNDPIAGSIPTQVGNLINLKELYIYRTQLSQPIPKEIGNLTNLEYLDLSFNQLSGETHRSKR